MSESVKEFHLAALWLPLSNDGLFALGRRLGRRSLTYELMTWATLREYRAAAAMHWPYDYDEHHPIPEHYLQGWVVGRREQ